MIDAKAGGSRGKDDDNDSDDYVDDNDDDDDGDDDDYDAEIAVDFVHPPYDIHG